MNSIQFLISTAISVYSFILILRVWFQVAKVDFYNPLSQTLVKVTQPAINPLSKFAPTIKGINTAALLACFILGVVKFPLLNLFGTLLGASLFEYAIIGALSVLHSIGEAIFYDAAISSNASPPARWPPPCFQPHGLPNLPLSLRPCPARPSRAASPCIS